MKIDLLHIDSFHYVENSRNETKYLRVDQIKFVEDSL